MRGFHEKPAAGKGAAARLDARSCVESFLLIAGASVRRAWFVENSVFENHQSRLLCVGQILQLQIETQSIKKQMRADFVRFGNALPLPR
jgi:hypothetical protein